MCLNRNIVICTDTLCKSCFTRSCPRTGHCPEGRIVACKHCYKLNVITEECNCLNRSERPTHSLRLIGSPSAPFLYFDVKLFNRSIPAMINTSIQISRINHNLSVWLQMKSNGSVNPEANEIIVPVKRQGKTVDIHCKIKNPQAELIQIGTEMLHRFGYTFIFERVTIDSDTSPILAGPLEVEYVYNLKPRGYQIG